MLRKPKVDDFKLFRPENSELALRTGKYGQGCGAPVSAKTHRRRRGHTAALYSTASSGIMAELY